LSGERRGQLVADVGEQIAFQAVERAQLEVAALQGPVAHLGSVIEPASRPMWLKVRASTPVRRRCRFEPALESSLGKSAPR
jgi:hypothetical protein